MCKEIGKRKAMLSQPMAGQTDEEIIATREKAVKALEEMGVLTNGMTRKTWKSGELCRFRCVSLQSHWKT